MSPWALRSCASIIWVTLLLSLLRNREIAKLSSSLFILPSLILVFYLLAGAILVERLGGATPINDAAEYAAEYARRAQWDILYIFKNMRLAYGSRAELMTVQFTLFLLAILAAVSGLPRPAAETPPSPGKTEILTLLGLAAGASVTARIVTAQAMWEHPIAFALLPLAAFTVAQAAMYWAAGWRRGGPLFVAVVLISWAGFFGQGLKPLAFMLPSCLILVVGRRKYGHRQILGLLGSLAVLSFVTITLMGVARNNINIAHLLRDPIAVIGTKVVSRQAETMFCLTSAANAADLASAGNRNPPDPGFIFGILIPRALWPDKPNYSLGGRYAVDYCLTSAFDQARSHQSASITLLGEPLLHGGRPMLGLFTLVIAAILAGLAVASERGPPALAATVLAMTGWMVDFDQHSTLYLGNAVKVALCLLGPALLFHWLERRPRGPSDPGPAPG
jgi:hypothetical protein